MLRCTGEANVTECVVSTTIRYTHFHRLIHKLKRSWQEVTRTSLKRGCVRSFNERQKQTESEMKGLISIRLVVTAPLKTFGNRCECHRSSDWLIDWLIDWLDTPYRQYFSHVTAATIISMWSVLNFWSFPGGPHEPSLHRNIVKRSLACQGGCYPWHGAPFNIPSAGPRRWPS